MLCHSQGGIIHSFWKTLLAPARPADFLVALLLGAGLVLPPAASYEAVYVTAATALVLSCVALASDRSILRLPGAKLGALAVAMIVTATILVGPTISDWAGPGIVGLVFLSLGMFGAAIVVICGTTRLARAFFRRLMTRVRCGHMFGLSARLSDRWP